jgi:2-keto-4-pentenoate hydratase/2-oxohepta-3-ene-1,7-dioic acid hydratase in catechol pathway
VSIPGGAAIVDAEVLGAGETLRAGETQRVRPGDEVVTEIEGVGRLVDTIVAQARVLEGVKA